MAINFPSTGLVANVTTYTSGSSTWIWDGIAWNIKPPGSNLDDLTDVNVLTVTDGQVLYYNGTSSNWEALTLTSSFNGGSIGNALNILSTATSSTYSSGALIVGGGVGIGGAVHTAGDITAGQKLIAGTGLTVSTGGADITGTLTLGSTSDIAVNTNKFTVTASSGNTSVGGTFAVTSTSAFTGNITLRTRSELRLNDTDNSNYVAIRAVANLTANTIYTLPGTDGTSGQALTTNGLGVLSWANITGGGGGGGTSNPPGGADGDIQFKNGTAFGGTSTLSYNSASDTVSLNNLTVSGIVDGSTTATLTNLAGITFVTGATVDTFDTDNTLAGNSDTSVATQAAVKTYVDTGLDLKAPIDSPAFTGTVTGITNDMVGLGNVENTALSTWAGSTSITTVGTLTDLSVDGNITAPTVPTQTSHVTNKKYVDSRAIAMSIALS